MTNFSCLQTEFEGIEGGCETIFRRVEAAQVGAAAGIAGKFEEALAVRHLLQRLHAHPGGEAGEVFRLEIAGHRQVQVGGEKLVFHLLVKGILQFGGKHAIILLIEMSHGSVMIQQ